MRDRCGSSWLWLSSVLLALVAVAGVSSGSLVIAHELVAHVAASDAAADHDSTQETDCPTCHLLTSLRADVPEQVVRIGWDSPIALMAARVDLRVDAQSMHRLPLLRGPPAV